MTAEQPRKLRKWYREDPSGGRRDVDGVEWFLTDGHSGWYRWEGMDLITKAHPKFNDGFYDNGDPPYGTTISEFYAMVAKAVGPKPKVSYQEQQMMSTLKAIDEGTDPVLNAIGKAHIERERGTKQQLMMFTAFLQLNCWPIEPKDSKGAFNNDEALEDLIDQYLSPTRIVDKTND